MPRKKKKEPVEPIEERTLEGMRVVRTGRGMYECSSESEPEKKYCVDILFYNGLGACDCDDFRFRRYPRYKGVKKNYNVFRCKHLARVRNHVLDQILSSYLQKEANQ